MRPTLCSVGMACMLLTACGDDPFLLRWTANLQESVLFSLDRDELNRASGFNMLSGATIVIENPQVEGDWDFSAERQGGQMVLLPPGALGVLSRAAVAALPGMLFDEVTRAPTDTLVYITDQPVPVDLGTIYVVRTHEQIGSFGRVCVYYGKIQPLEINLQAGIFRFLHNTSPDCNNRSLIPPN